MMKEQGFRKLSIKKKNKTSYFQFGKGYDRIPKAFSKTNKVLWEKRWIKKDVESWQIHPQITFQQCSHNVCI